MMTAIEKVQGRSEEILNGAVDAERSDGKCRAPAIFPNDPPMNSAIAQGDLYLVVTDHVPEGYVERTDGNLQLVPGESTGARHCLVAGSPCKVFDPPGFGPEYDELHGPVLKTEGATEVAHPVHANVVISPGTFISCEYQRTWDAEQRRERRARD
jgi:hypothetical protein